jgi:hypothetical protein
MFQKIPNGISALGVLAEMFVGHSNSKRTKKPELVKEVSSSNNGR